MSRIFRPLPVDHPLVLDKTICPVCLQPFMPSQRVVLRGVRDGQSGEVVQAIPLHATCSLQGARTPVGIIERVKDGDASPHPLITDRGEFTIQEAGFYE